VNAAFMSFQPHESGIHAVWPDAGEGSVTEVRFRAGRGRWRGAQSRDHRSQNELETQKHQE